MSSGREIMPALGPSWASCVDMRIFLSRPGIKDAPAPPPSFTLVTFPSSAVLDVHAHYDIDPQQRNCSAYMIFKRASACISSDQVPQ